MEDKKSGREAVVLVVVVFVLGVVLGSLGTHLWGGRVWDQPRQPHGRDQLILQLSHELQLTPEQQRQLTTIMDDTRTKWRALYLPLEPQHEAIRQQSRERIRAILTPEQRPQFEDFVRRLDEERKRQEGH